MKKLARLILLCLMMIAIPVQGIAATAMVCCGGEHHQPVMVDENDQSHDYSSQQVHGEHAADLNADGSCSCVDCCDDCSIGCSLTMDSSDVVFPLTSEKISLSFSFVAGHISDGPERPPRA